MASAAELQALMDRNPRQIGFYAVLMDVRNAVSDILDRTSLAEVLRRSSAIQDGSSAEQPASEGVDED